MAKSVLVGAFLFACGLVVGVGVSSLMTSSGHEVEADAAEASFSPVSKSPDRSSEPAIEDAPSIVADADVKRATEDVVSTVERAAATSTAAPPRGDGVLSGRVADKEGAGVRGALVRASLSAGRGAEASRSKLGRAIGDRSLETEIQNAVDGWQKRKSTTLEARTDGNGDYRFENLGDGPWSLSAECEGYWIQSRGTAINLPPGSTVNFEAKAVTRVPLTVLLPDGRDARRVNIEVKPTGSDNMSYDLWTTEDPTIHVVPGVYQVRAILVAQQKTANDYAIEAASQKVRVDAQAIGEIAPVELKLEPRHGIRGRVILGEGIRMQQGCVAMQQVPAGREPDLQSLSNVDRKEWIHSASNTFEFLDLAPGSYVIGLMNGWQGPVLEHAVVKVEQGVVERDLEVKAIDGSQFLDVWVKGPVGEPLACQNFIYLVDSGQGSHSSWVQGIEQEPGHYWIAPDPEMKRWFDDTSGKVKFTLTAKSDAYGDKSIEVARGTREIVFQFGESATLDVVVVGYLGSGFEGQMEVQLQRPGVEQHYYSNETTLQADGTAKFGPVEVGEYVLELQSFGENRWNRRTVASQKLNLVAGTNRASIAVPALYTVVVTIAGGEGGRQWVSMQGDGRWDNAQVVDGRAEFKNVAAGEYTFHGEVDGKQARETIKVPDQLQVTLVPKAPNAMMINIQDETKYLKAAGFQNGDLIVGFDGVEFQDEQVMQSTFSTLIGKKSATAIIQRGTQRLEIKVDPAKLLDPTQVGGNWWPTAR